MRSSDFDPTPKMAKKGEEEHDYDFVAPVKLEIECPVCLQTLQDPHIVSCCGHNFCRACISRIQRDYKPCPLCKTRIFKTMANQSLKRALNNSEVHCAHHDQGCEWIGELVKLDQHLNADPQPERQLEGCPFTSVVCIHCKDHVRRRVLAGHQNERCPKRPSTCEYCEEYESTFEDVASHWEECQCYLVPCPNNCNPSGPGIERQNLEHHVKEDCPMIIVECDFHYAGCAVKLPQKDITFHMKDKALVHMSLLTAMNQKLTEQLLEKDEQLQTQQHTLTQRLLDLEESTGQKLSRNRRELESSHMKLKEEVNKTQAVMAIVLTFVLVISVVFACILHYHVPLQRDTE